MATSTLGAFLIFLTLWLGWFVILFFETEKDNDPRVGLNLPRR